MYLDEQPTFRASMSLLRLTIEAVCAALFLGGLAACIA
jgi:hypothetical protein